MTTWDRIIEYVNNLDLAELNEETKKWIMDLEDYK